MITVAETRTFQKKVSRLPFESEREDLITYLFGHPCARVIMEGSGGIRKLRWARSGRGKSGGIRVVYYFYDETMPLYLPAEFGKNEKASLSKKERNLLAKVVEELARISHQLMRRSRRICPACGRLRPKA